MSLIHGNPPAMRDFAARLSAYCLETRDHLGSVAGRLRDLGSGDWTDENYARFCEQFEQAAAALGRSIDELEHELAPHVRHLAGRYEELLHD